MCSSGTTFSVLFGICGIAETVFAFICQAPIIYYIPDFLVIVIVAIYDTLAYVGFGEILMFMKILAYIPDWIIGWTNAAVWACWIGLTTVLCALALGPWSCAAASCCASIPSDIGLVLDCCSWCFLNVQILWLRHLFFQSFSG